LRSTIVVLIFIVTFCISTLMINHIFELEAERWEWLEIPETPLLVGNQAEKYPSVGLILSADARTFSSVVFGVALALLLGGLAAKANLPRILTLEDEIIAELENGVSKFAGDLELEDVILSEIETP
jgi:hypothetical protein